MYDCVAIVGPKGSGKSTIETILAKEYDFHKVVSDTTRKSRPGERDGVDYNFVSEHQFRQHNLNKQYAEWVQARGAYYGIRKSELMYKDSVVVVDLEGLKQIKGTGIKPLVVSLKAPMVVRWYRIHGRDNLRVFLKDTLHF